jgi:hypothetical protein
VEARVLLLDQQVFNLLRRARSVDFSYPKSDCWTGSEKLKQHSSNQLNAPFAADAAAARQQICFPGFIAFSNIDSMDRVMCIRGDRKWPEVASTCGLPCKRRSFCRSKRFGTLLAFACCNANSTL